MNRRVSELWDRVYHDMQEALACNARNRVGNKVYSAARSRIPQRIDTYMARGTRARLLLRRIR